MSVRELILAKSRERDISLASLSKGAGKSHSYLQQFIERGSPKKLPEDVREYVASRLGIDQSALKDAGSVKAQMSQNRSPSKKGVNIPEFSVTNAGPVDLLRVLGMAEGGPDGWNMLNGDIVEYITRPEGLRGVPHGYAVYVRGDSMSPRYDAGDKVYVHPGKPVLPGHYVLVQRRNPDDPIHPFAVIKRLVKRAGGKVILAQLNPEKQITLLADEVVSIHRVIGHEEA